MKTTVAVIGCGRISHSHIPALVQMENVRIKYACDLIIEKADAMKEEVLFHHIYPGLYCW